MTILKTFVADEPCPRCGSRQSIDRYVGERNGQHYAILRCTWRRCADFDAWIDSRFASLKKGRPASRQLLIIYYIKRYAEWLIKQHSRPNHSARRCSQ